MSDEAPEQPRQTQSRHAPEAAPLFHVGPHPTPPDRRSTPSWFPIARRLAVPTADVTPAVDEPAAEPTGRAAAESAGAPSWGGAVQSTPAGPPPAPPGASGGGPRLHGAGFTPPPRRLRATPGIVPVPDTIFPADRFLRPAARPPRRGWQHIVWVLSGGRCSPAPGAAEKHGRELLARIQAPVRGCATIAVASGKGGVGKTTVSMLCGTALAMNRGDRVLALDANPDAGSLGHRVRRQTEATLTDLLRDAPTIERYSQLRSYTSQAPSRLEVIASANDPAVSQAIGEAEYRAALALLEHHYTIVLADLGTGLLDSATQGLLRQAGQVIVVTAPSLDAARVADYTLDFIERRHPHKVRDGIVVINSVRRDSLVNVRALEQHFRTRVRATIRVPYDRHLAGGGEPSWEALTPATRDAYLRLAAAVADRFSAAF